MTNTSLACWAELLDLPSRVEPVQERHRDVEDDDVRLEPLRFGDERPSVGDGADDLAFGRQQLLERAEKKIVVVGQQHPWTWHVC